MQDLLDDLKSELSGFLTSFLFVKCLFRVLSVFQSFFLRYRMFFCIHEFRAVKTSDYEGIRRSRRESFY